MPFESEDAAPRAGRREWLGLAVLALACLLYAMDLTVLHLAVPNLLRRVGARSDSNEHPEGDSDSPARNDGGSERIEGGDGVDPSEEAPAPGAPMGGNGRHMAEALD
jgi:hypothetical protein